MRDTYDKAQARVIHNDLVHGSLKVNGAVVMHGTVCHPSLQYPYHEVRYYSVRCLDQWWLISLGTLGYRDILRIGVHDCSIGSDKSSAPSELHDMLERLIVTETEEGLVAVIV